MNARQPLGIFELVFAQQPEAEAQADFSFAQMQEQLVEPPLFAPGAAAFDYQGRTLAADYATTKQAMISYVPTQVVKTIYAVIGDLFAWLSMAGFVALVGLARLRPARS